MKQATIMLTGDLMCQPRQQRKALNPDTNTFDFKGTFRYVKNIFREADFVIGNLETLISPSLPLSKDLWSINGKPFLNGPKEFLKALKWAGFHALITANNHANDGDRRGLSDTLDSIDDLGLLHTGTFRNKRETRHILANVNGIRVGFLGYATYYNQSLSFKLFSRRKYLSNQARFEKIKKDVQTLREAGAQFIIAYNHCGTEHVQEPSPRERKYARLLAEGGVDYIINSHPHVLQPFEYIERKDGKKVPIMFSMGNFSTGMKDSLCRETLILKLVLEENGETGEVKVTHQSYCPCFVLKSFREDSYTIVPEDKRYNEGFYSKKVPANFNHIREIVGTEEFDFF